MTKMDVDTKGGSAISISYITSKPIFYVETGKGDDDDDYLIVRSSFKKLEEEPIDD